MIKSQDLNLTERLVSNFEAEIVALALATEAEMKNGVAYKKTFMSLSLSCTNDQKSEKSR